MCAVIQESSQEGSGRETWLEQRGECDTERKKEKDTGPTTREQRGPHETHEFRMVPKAITAPKLE